MANFTTIPCTVRQMSEPERAYLGALIDGEGFLGWEGETRADRRRKNYGHIKLGNTDLELISAPLRATGVGTVRLDESYARRSKAYKPYWVWGVWRMEDVAEIARQCAPYSTKCQRFLDTRKERRKS